MATSRHAERMLQELEYKAHSRIVDFCQDPSSLSTRIRFQNGMMAMVHDYYITEREIQAYLMAPNYYANYPTDYIAATSLQYASVTTTNHIPEEPPKCSSCGEKHSASLDFAGRCEKTLKKMHESLKIVNAYNTSTQPIA